MPIPVPDLVTGEPSIDVGRPPVAGAPGKVDKSVLAKLGQVLNSMSQVMTTGNGQAVGTPGIVGGAPVNLAQGPPQGASAIPMTSSSAPPRGTPLPRNEFVPMPGPQSSGFTFADKKSATAATVHDAVTNFTNIVNTFKQRNDQQNKKRAEVLSRSLYDAMERGDNDLINEILGGKDGQKNIKILEKAGIGVPPEIQKVEPPTPEQQGVHQGIRYAIAAKASKAQEAQALAAQNALTQQQALASRYSQDPAAAAADVRGTALSSEEQRQAERYNAQLEMNPVVATQMSQQQKQFDKELGQRIGEMHMNYNLELQKFMEQKRQFGEQLSADKDFRKIQGDYWKAQTGLEKARLDLEASRVAASTKDDFFKGYNVLIDNYTRQLTNIDDNIANLAGKDTDEAKALLPQYQQLRQRTQNALNSAQQIVEMKTAEDELKKMFEEAK